MRIADTRERDGKSAGKEIVQTGMCVERSCVGREDEVEEERCGLRSDER